MLKRIASSAAALLIAATAAACAQTPASTDNTDAENGQTVATSVFETESETRASDAVRALFADTDLGGATFNIIAPAASSHWIYSGKFNEVCADEYTGEIVNDSLYERNMAVQELLNCKLTFDLQTSLGNIETVVAQNAAAGDATYDIALTTMTAQASNMLKGNLLNVKMLGNLNLENPWWDKNEIDTFTYKNKLYWLCGDINIGDDYAVQVLYFNKKMCNDFGLETPYNAILDGTWTIDKMYGMTTSVKADLDSDGSMTINDRWGLVECNNHVMHWLYPMGETLVDVGADGTLEPRILNERHINAVDTLFDYFVTKGMAYPGDVNNDVTPFTESRTLFYGNQLYTLELLRDMEDDFGIIPMPKMTSDQKSYGAFISHGGGTAFAVPVTNNRHDETGALLEALCGMSTDTLRSAFYDVLFSSKFVRDEESVAMLDTIFANKTYDWGVDFSWASSFTSLYANLITSGTNDYVSTATKLQKSSAKLLAKAVETIENLP